MADVPASRMDPGAGPGWPGGRMKLSWESVSVLCLALWFLIPGVVALVSLILRALTSEEGGTLLSAVSIAFTVLLIAIGLLILSGRYFLALIYLLFDLALSLTAGSGGAGNAGLHGGWMGHAASIGFLVVGVLWILEREIVSRRQDRWTRPAGILLVAAFALNVPLVAQRAGGALGTVLGPRPVSRVLEAGQRLPRLRFVGEDGRFLYLDEPGTVYVVSFWATWCAPCLLELPELLRTVQELPADTPVRFLAVNTEGMNGRSLQGFLKERGLQDLPVYTDPDGYKDLLGAKTIPLTALVQDRMLLVKHVGYTQAELVKREIHTALDRQVGQAGGPSPERPVP